jgi:hypothetical protein
VHELEWQMLQHSTTPNNLLPGRQYQSKTLGIMQVPSQLKLYTVLKIPEEKGKSNNFWS